MDYGQRGILLCQISRKYVCGIHFAHIMAGVNWTLSSHPLVKQTLVILEKMCEAMASWPTYSAMRFGDLAWATASSLACFCPFKVASLLFNPRQSAPYSTGQTCK